LSRVSGGYARLANVAPLEVRKASGSAQEAKLFEPGDKGVNARPAVVACCWAQGPGKVFS